MKRGREREKENPGVIYFILVFFFKLKCSIPPLNRLKYNYDLWNEFNK